MFRRAQGVLDRAGACAETVRLVGDGRSTWLVPDARAREERACRVEEEFRRYVTERQQCSRDSDCVVVRTDCPFGCKGIPVSASHADEVIQKQDEIYSRLESRCVSKCERLVTRTVCDKGWCLAAW